MFLINLIPLHVLTLMVTGRFSHRIYVAYSTLYCVGTVLSMQISFVGFQPVQSSEHMLVSTVQTGLRSPVIQCRLFWELYKSKNLFTGTQCNTGPVIIHPKTNTHFIKTVEYPYVKNACYSESAVFFSVLMVVSAKTAEFRALRMLLSFWQMCGMITAVSWWSSGKE